MIIDIIITVLILAFFILLSPQIKKLETKNIVILGIFCAIAATAGAALRSIPGIQPTSFLIIMSGWLLGGGSGFLCGVATSFLFDLLSTFSVFTTWRMLLWGLMGLGAAFIPKKPYFLAAYGFVWGFVFGWILNSVYLFRGFVPLTIKSFILSCVSSFWFDLSHGLCNAVLLIIFSIPVKKLYEKRM